MVKLKYEKSSKMETAKNRNFVNEPMGNKDVTEVSGVGPITGKRMVRKKFSKAWMLFGQFLLLKKNAPDFCFWLETTFSMQERDANQCCQCFSQWCDSFL